MKICHINLARVYRGGERQTELLIKNLSKRGMEQYAVVRAGTKLAAELHSVKNLEIIGLKKRHWLGLQLPKDAALVHAHEAKAAHLAFWNHLANRTPYIITRRVPNSPKKDPITRLVYRRASVIVALSKAIAATLHRYDATLPVEIIASMPTGMPVNPEHVQLLRKKYNGYFVIGHIGALQQRHKGQQFLIEAARSLASSHPKLLFLLLGEGEDENKLKRLAHGLPSVQFLGFKEAVADYLNVFDLFVFPSLKEGLGSVLLDALQHGRAIIASDVDGIKEIIRHGENGILVPPGNSDALAKAILALYLDHNKRHSLSLAATQSIARFSPETSVNAYLEVYRAASQ